MTEKQETAEKLESLSDRIWRRLFGVISSLLLSSVIAFFVFKFISENFDNSLRAVALGIIAIGAIASVISITVGYKYKDRQLGLTLAFLIPVVLSMEAAIQFGEPLEDVIAIGFMGLFLLALFVYIFAYNMLLPLLDIENIKTEDVECIQIFSPISDVARLIEEWLSFLNLSEVKTSGADDGKQWRFSSRSHPQICYLYVQSEDGNSLDLAFLNFTERSNDLYRSEKDKKYLNFLKGTFEVYLKQHNIKCESVQNSDLSSKTIKEATRKYKRAREGDRLRDIGKFVEAHFKLIIIISIIAILLYTGRHAVTQYYDQYPWIFIIIASLLYPITRYIREIIEGMSKNER